MQSTLKKPGLVARAMNACKGANALRAFFVISAMESSFFPIPIDLAMVPIGIAQRSRMWLVVMIGTAGSVFGAALGYLTGALFFATLGQWLIELYGFDSQASHVRQLFLDNGFLAIAVAGLSPIPFKLAAILSGSMGMNLTFFLLATFGVRLLRFSLMGLMVYIFGRPLEKLMQTHFSIFGGLLLLTMVAGFLITPLIF